MTRLCPIAIAIAITMSGATQASDQAPNDMRLQRSTDGVTWVDVLTVLDQTGWDDNGTERTFN